MARKVKVEPSTIPDFKCVGIKSDALPAAKVAANGDTPFIVRFTPSASFTIPQEAAIVCTTDRECLVIPIHFTDTRGIDFSFSLVSVCNMLNAKVAIFELPDALDFEPVAVHQKVTMSITVKNVGKVEGTIALAVKAPFSLSVPHLTLAAGNAEVVTCTYHPHTVETSTEMLQATLPGGLVTQIHLGGVSQSRAVTVDTSEITMDTVYVTRLSEKTITVQNKSNQKVSMFASCRSRPRRLMDDAGQLPFLAVFRPPRGASTSPSDQHGCQGTLPSFLSTVIIRLTVHRRKRSNPYQIRWQRL